MMEPEPGPQHRTVLPAILGRSFVPLALLGMAVVIILFRIHTFHEPLERDITTYSVIANEIAKGRALYRDVWDHKPPGVYWVYAAAVGLLGMGPLQVFALGIAAALASLPGIYLAGKAIGGRESGLLAAAFWTLISANLPLQANQPNSEVFINLLLIWGAVLYFSRSTYSLRTNRAIAMGILYAAASLFKQTTITIPAFLCLAHVLFLPGTVAGSRQARVRKSALKDVAVLWSVVIGAWALLLAHYMASGLFADFYAAVVEYNLDYSGNPFRNLVSGFHPSVLAPACMKGMLPLVIVSLLGIYAGARGENKRSWIALRFVVYGTVISIGLSSKWFPHYYQYWLPLLAIAGGWVWAEAAAGTILQRRTVRRTLVLSAMLLTAFSEAYQHMRLSALELPVAKYADEGRRFQDSMTLGPALEKVLLPGETFYHFGAEPGLYFYSKRRPPVPFLVNYPLLGGRHAVAFSERVVYALDSTRPELVIATKPLDTELDHPVVNWIGQHYRWVDVSWSTRSFVVLVLKGGRLDNLWRRGTLPGLVQPSGRGSHDLPQMDTAKSQPRIP